MMTKDDFRRHGGEGGPTRVSFREWWLILEYLLVIDGGRGSTYGTARRLWEQNLTPRAAKAVLDAEACEPVAPVPHDLPMPGDPDGPVFPRALGTPVTIDRVLDEVQKAKRYPRGEIRLHRDEHGHEFRALLREYAGASPDTRDFGNRFDAVAWLKERGCAEEAILHVGFTP